MKMTFFHFLFIFCLNVIRSGKMLSDLLKRILLPELQWGYRTGVMGKAGCGELRDGTAWAKFALVSLHVRQNPAGQ